MKETLTKPSASSAPSFESDLGTKEIEARIGALEQKLESGEGVGAFPPSTYGELQSLIAEVRAQLADGDGERYGMYGATQDPELSANLKRITDFEEMIFGDEKKVTPPQAVEKAPVTIEKNASETFVTKLTSKEGQEELKSKFENITASTEALLSNRGLLEDTLEQLEREGKIKGWKRFVIARESLRPFFGNLKGNEPFSAGVLAAYSGVIQEFIEAASELEVSLESMDSKKTDSTVTEAEPSAPEGMPSTIPGSFDPNAGSADVGPRAAKVDDGDAGSIIPPGSLDTGALDNAAGGAPASVEVAAAAPQGAYESARAEWKDARSEWQAVKIEYQTKLAEYYESLEKRGLWSKLRGTNAEKPQALIDAEQKYLAVRKRYISAVKEGLAQRETERTVGKETKFVYGNEMVKGAVGGRFVVDVVKQQLDLRKEIAGRYRPELVKKTEKWLETHKGTIRKTALGVGIFATGGLALIPKGMQAVGVKMGGTAGAALTKASMMFTGAAVGGLLGGIIGNRGVEYLSTRWRRKDAEKSIKTARGTISSDNIAALEASVLDTQKRLQSSETAKKWATRGGVAVGAAAGMYAGGSLDDGLPQGGGEISAANAMENPGSIGDAGGSEISNPGGAESLTVSNNADATVSEQLARAEASAAEDLESLNEKSEADIEATLNDAASNEMAEANIADGNVAGEALPTEEIPDSLKDADSGYMAEANIADGENAFGNPSEVGEPASEVVGVGSYEVKSGDNLWNIMEGSGPDSNPQGGLSEVVKDMPQGERNVALDTLFDYMNANPEFTKSVGIPSGDPDLIRTGDNIDIAALDAKMTELLGQKAEIMPDVATSEVASVEVPPAPAPVSEEVPAEPLVADLAKETAIPVRVEPVVETGPVAVKSEVLETPIGEPNVTPVEVVPATYETPAVASAEAPVDLAAYEELKDLTVGEMLDLQQTLIAGGGSESLLKLGVTPEELQESINWIMEHGEGDIDRSLTFDTYIDKFKYIEFDPSAKPVEGDYDYVVENDETVPEMTETPASTAAVELAPLPEGTETAIANAVPTLDQQVNNYITTIEKGEPGFLGMIGGTPSVEGTYAKMADVPLGDVISLEQDPDALTTFFSEKDITEEGWNRWLDTINEMHTKVPASESETLGQYVTRFAEASGGGSSNSAVA